MIPEFVCNGLMATDPADDKCTCAGCRQNRAVRAAVEAERQRCAAIADVWSDTTAGRDIAHRIREVPQ